jgi:ankyrin repeat protein
MTNSTRLFALADADDARALVEALGATESFHIRNDNGETLLLYSLFRGRAKCVEALKSRSGLTLHEAAAIGDSRRVEECVRTAPWTTQSLSADGWPALHLAAFLGHDKIIVRLLDLGADPRQRARGVDQNLAIHAAAGGRRIGREAYAKLIAATGDPDVLNQGYTALMIAAGNGFSDGVESLLAAGADKSRKHEDGRTAASFARERGHEELAKRLSSPK